MSAVLEIPSRERCVVRVAGALHVPWARDLTEKVRSLVRRGERDIVIDLADVPTIDAGGIGELIRIYRRIAGVNGTLRIIHARERVRTLLDRVGLFDLLNDSDVSSFSGSIESFVLLTRGDQDGNV